MRTSHKVIKTILCDDNNNNAENNHIRSATRRISKCNHKQKNSKKKNDEKLQRVFKRG